MNSRSLFAVLLAALMPTLLAGCGAGEAIYPERGKWDSAPQYGDKPRETIFGEGGLFDSGGARKKQETQSGIGVNAFLWRATLDTVAFMPLSSADPFGGIILTDWYAPPETANERFKMTVLILDRTLRADAVKVSVFRQTRDSVGGWADAPANARLATDLENTILTRARQLRQQSQ